MQTNLVDNNQSYQCCLSPIYRLPQTIWTCAQHGFSHAVSFMKAACLEAWYTVKKIHITVIEHFLANFLSPSSGTVLIKAKNLSQKTVIWNETDRQQAIHFKELIIKNPSKHTVDEEGLEILKNFTPERLALTGICFGATLWTIRSILSANPQSENELITLLQPFASGFPAEAGGLQYLQKPLVDWYPKLPKKVEEKFAQDLENARTEFMKQLDIEYLNLKKSNDKEFILQKTKEINLKVPELLQQMETNLTREMYNQFRIDRVQSIAHSIDLQLTDIGEPERTDFSGINLEDTIKDKFDKLPVGCYQLLYPTIHEKHSITYINMPFGSYIFDSNYGLIPCNQNKPSLVLCTLLKEEYSSDSIKPQDLSVYRYQLEM